MKCPNCKDGFIKIRSLYCGLVNTHGIQCPDCKGKGEIQENEWWMCKLEWTSEEDKNTPDGNFVFKFHNRDNKEWWEDFSGFWYTVKDDLTITPLYKMERVKEKETS
jgi:hypothetical protein